MAEYWYNNGNAQSSLGKVGYTGANRYVVVYSFTVGSNGCSSVTVNMTNMFTHTGSNDLCLKIATSPSQYASGTASPDGTGTMSYGSSWGGSITCNINLTAGTYYATIYSTSVGYWESVYSGAGTVTTSGSYTPTPTASSISTCTSALNTQEYLQIQMNNPGGLTHYAQFYYGSTLLATSSNFTNSLNYQCPRSWFSNWTTLTSLALTVKVYTTGGTHVGDRSCTLTADSGMKPVLSSSSITATKINTGTIDAFIATLTKIQIDFTTGNIDLSNCAGASLNGVWIEYNGVANTEHETGYPYRFKTQTISSSGSGYVRCWAMDTRGRTGYYDYTFTAYAYVAPYLSEVTVYRTEGSSTEVETGTWFLVKAKEEITDITGNSRTVEVYHKETSASEYTQDMNLNDPTGVYGMLYYPPLDATKTYMVKLVAKDSAGGSQEYEYQLSFEKWMICWRPNADNSEYGCGIGQAPDNTKVLQIPSDWELLAGSARFGHDRMMLVEGKHYDSSLPSSGAEGQVFFLLVNS